MKYPVLLCGDQIEFEREHASTPPEERPDWPLPSFDARDWAKAFCKIAKQHGHDLDEGWMTTWFANALMRGYDERTAQEPVSRWRYWRIYWTLRIRYWRAKRNLAA